VLLTGKFNASSISLRLYGYNIACFMPMQDGKMAAGTGKPIRMSETVIDVNFKLSSFAEGTEQTGHSAYPFTLKLPDWLPDSVMLKDGHLALTTVYFLIA